MVNTITLASAALCLFSLGIYVHLKNISIKLAIPYALALQCTAIDNINHDLE